VVNKKKIKKNETAKRKEKKPKPRLLRASSRMSSRKLAAIMFTDMVGYTAMAQKDEARAVELLEEHRRFLRPIFRKYRGREIDTIGDAFLVEFTSALDAVRCSLEIQSFLKKLNERRSIERKITLRIGIHLGDVIHKGRNVSGDAVNVASRIEPLAEPGGVCLTAQVYYSVINKVECGFESIGNPHLKNVDTPIEMYKILGLKASASSQVRHAVTLPRNRIAVLPFVNMSPNPDDEYFADGMTEELITKLSEIQGLRVIARTSVMSYKNNKEKGVAQIGRELSVGSIIEGSVRKADNKIRITTQLIDTQNEEHLWASNYDRELDDIFAIQSDVASKVAVSLQLGVFAKPLKKDTADITAYTLYLRAMKLLWKRTHQSVRESISLLEKAIEEDPPYAKAHSELSWAWATLIEFGQENYAFVVAKAEEEARKALELGPDLAEAHVAMAQVNMLLDKIEEMAEEAQRAVQIDPNLTDGYHMIGIYNAAVGNIRLAIDAFKKAYELDPLSINIGSLLADCYDLAGQFNDSLEVRENLRRLYPNHPRVYSGYVQHYILQRDYGKAQEMVDAGVMIDPSDHGLKLGQATIYAHSGRRKEAEEMLQEIKNWPNEALRLQAEMSINIVLGNLDAAFDALSNAFVIHAWPWFITLDPSFQDLRKDPRYLDFRKKIGLPA
jgi:adenylate cyclase